jgi:hypothetical protein
MSFNKIPKDNEAMNTDSGSDNEIETKNGGFNKTTSSFFGNTSTSFGSTNLQNGGQITPVSFGFGGSASTQDTSNKTSSPAFSFNLSNDVGGASKSANKRNNTDDISSGSESDSDSSDKESKRTKVQISGLPGKKKDTQISKKNGQHRITDITK